MTQQALDYLSAASEQVVLYDGSVGVALQQLDLSADDFGGPDLEGCPDVLCLTRPDIVADLHRSYLELGVDAIVTNSFGASPVTLAEYGIADQTEVINRAAAQIARDAADEYGKWVAGSVGPGTKFPSLGNISFAELRDDYETQCRGLVAGGVDLIVIETVFDLLQGKAAIIGARRAMAALGRYVPLQVQVTFERTGKMLPGTEVGAALVALNALRPEIIGLNCSTGPAEMTEHLRYLGEHCPVPLSCSPNAGLPSVVDGHMHYDLTPDELADFHARFITEFGVSVVGGCCGTTPQHIRAVIDKCRSLTPLRRRPSLEPACASLYTAVPFHQSTSVLVVGERTNANGSKKFRDAMLADDWAACEAIAIEQVKEGAHLLDVCVDYTGEDGVADMREVASRFATTSSLPLMIDSTEAPVVEEALQFIGGRAVLNSVNLEDGDAPGTRLDLFLRLASEHGAAVVATCIDEDGQARDAEWKLRAARKIHDIAVHRYGLASEDLFFDPLVLPVSTGMEESRRDGIETIEGIRRIKAELPGVATIIGLSNISFGLVPAARQVLNSVFLHECMEAGLDAAIMHAARIVPLSRVDERAREVCLDLIYDRRREGYDPLSELLTMFEGVKATTAEREDRSGWPVDERLKARIVDGEPGGLEADLEQILQTTEPLVIINDVLLPGMKVVGELFGAGEMQLPFVLRSAEVMKSAVRYLEPLMERSGDHGRGRVVLATVKGDVHDIGKNLVDIILTNNGYNVYNLGVKVSIADMVAKAKEMSADVIGMSGLLVKSTLVMRENLQELNALGLSNIPVLLGGAALTRRYVERDLREVYEGRVFYGKDAFEGLATMERLMQIKQNGDDDADWGRVPVGRTLPERTATALPSDMAARRSPDVESDNPVFTPPFLGSRIVTGFRLDDIAEYLNETALFRNQWQYRPVDGESDDEFKARIRVELRPLLAEVARDTVLVPQVVYGYFPANGDGNDLVVWTDDTRSQEWGRFSYPRQSKAPYLCIADFFRPVESGEADYAAFTIVTMGARVSEHAAALFAADRYMDYLKLHGLGVEMTEALAELFHRRIREEWGFAGEDAPTKSGLFRQKYRGGRYSWGYPACPELEDNAKVARLLASERLGIEVSQETGWQYQPEQTTSALICHHPKAKYFVAR